MKISAEYAAGFFDGEGCVTISRRKGGRYFSGRATMGNTNEAIVRDFHDTFGGSLCFRPPAKATFKPQWVWVVDSSTCEAFLRAVLPHLRIKGPQAELVLRFLESRRRPVYERLEAVRDGAVGRHWKKTDETIAGEFALFDQVRVLNKRGVEPLVMV